MKLTLATGGQRPVTTAGETIAQRVNHAYCPDIAPRLSGRFCSAPV